MYPVAVSETPVEKVTVIVPEAGTACWHENFRVM